MRNTQQNYYEDLKTKFVYFLNSFQKNGRPIYRLKAEELLQRSQHLLVVSSIDLMAFSTEMWDALSEDYYRLEPHLNEALTNFMRELERSTRLEEEKNDR